MNIKLRMKRRILTAAVTGLLLLLTSSLLTATGANLGGVRLVFPEAEEFTALQQDFTETTGLAPGAALAEEFKQEAVGRVRSSSGLEGAIFKDAFLFPALALGKVSHLIYGTLAVPEGSRLAGREFTGDYGIIVYRDPIVIVLVERGQGELAAFVVTGYPAMGLAPLSVMSLLFQLITTPFAPPTPMPAPVSGLRFHLTLHCQELAVQEDLDVEVGSGAALVEIAGEFTVKENGLGSLKLISAGPGLQFLLSAQDLLNIGFVLPKKEQEVAIPLAGPFTLFVQGKEKKACIEAEVTATDGKYHIVGTAYHD